MEDELGFQEVVELGDPSRIGQYLDSLEPGESARLISRLEPEEQAGLMTALAPADAADLIGEMSQEQAAQLVGDLPAEQAAAIVDQLPSHDQAALLNRLPDEGAEEILAEFPPTEAEAVRELASYPRDTAGGMMITEYLVFRDNLRIRDVLDDLREHAEQYSQYDVQYAYVVKQSGRLVGVLRLRDLLLSRLDASVDSVMISNPLHVGTATPLDSLHRFFDHHALFGVPVVDGEGRSVGVVRRQDAEKAEAERASRTFLKFTGILGGEELRTMPLRRRSARRLSWLSINIVLNIIAASVIAFYQDTLAAVITLAVFLPIISDMSGCSGNQAVAVSMRELTLGLLKPRDILRVLSKEVGVGMINGVVLGLLLGAVAFAWKGSPALGLVVGVALAANTLLAVCLGGLIPLVLRAMKQDPALASGPILTTVTDMCGFFLVLSLAQAMLPYLSGA